MVTDSPTRSSFLFPSNSRAEQYKNGSSALAEEILKENLETRSQNVYGFLLEEGKVGADQQVSFSELISESSLPIIAGM